MRASESFEHRRLRLRSCADTAAAYYAVRKFGGRDASFSHFIFVSSGVWVGRIESESSVVSLRTSILIAGFQSARTSRFDSALWTSPFRLRLRLRRFGADRRRRHERGFLPVPGSAFFKAAFAQ